MKVPRRCLCEMRDLVSYSLFLFPLKSPIRIWKCPSADTLVLPPHSGILATPKAAAELINFPSAVFEYLLAAEFYIWKIIFSTNDFIIRKKQNSCWKRTEEQTVAARVIFLISKQREERSRWTFKKCRILKTHLQQIIGGGSKKSALLLFGC